MARLSEALQQSVDDAILRLVTGRTGSTSTGATWIQFVTGSTTTYTTTSPLQTSGSNAGTSPAPAEERAEPMGYKKPDIVPGFRAEDPDMIHVIDQVGVLITETRLSNLVSLLEYNAKIATIFNGRQVEAIMNEVNGTLWE